MVQNDVYEWLVNWFVQKTGLTTDAIILQNNASYFEEGWIDSFGFVRLILEIEAAFKIKFLNDEFQRVEFSTLVGLTKIIKEKLDGNIGVCTQATFESNFL